MATISVSTFQELQNAVGNSRPGDEIVLQNSITASGNPWRISKRSFTIDLNRNILEIECAFLIMESSNVTIKNGTINGRWRNEANIQGSTLRLENVYVGAEVQLYQAVYGGKIYLVDCSFSNETLQDCIATARGEGSAIYIQGGSFNQPENYPLFLVKEGATLDISSSESGDCELTASRHYSTDIRALVEAQVGATIIIHSGVQLIGYDQPCVTLMMSTLLVEGGKLSSSAQPAINLTGVNNKVEFKPRGSTEYISNQGIIQVTADPAISSSSPDTDSVSVYGGQFRASGNIIFTPATGFDNVSLVRLDYLGEVNPDWIAEGSAVMTKGKIRATGDPDGPEPPRPPDPPVPPGPGPSEDKYVKDATAYISPNIKSYSNMYTGVIWVHEETFESFGEALKKVHFKLPGSGKWAVRYIKSSELE